MKRLEIFDEESRTRSDPLSSCLSEEQVRHASRRTSLFLIDPASALWTVTNPTCRSRGFPRPLNQLQFTFWYSFFYTKYLSYIPPCQSVSSFVARFFIQDDQGSFCKKVLRYFLSRTYLFLVTRFLFKIWPRIFLQLLLAGCKRPSQDTHWKTQRTSFIYDSFQSIYTTIFELWEKAAKIRLIFFFFFFFFLYQRND